MRQIIEDKNFDEERSLYNLQNAEVINCIFAGPKDGESVLKETRDINISGCSFSLRYPLWHTKRFTLINSTMDDKTRAAIWYAEAGQIKDCKMNGIKCLRECRNVEIINCQAASPEFGWKCRNINILDSEMDAEYFLFECSDVTIDNLNMTGKYSFQYNKNLHIKNSVLDTKDAFWHGENVTVENSIVKGEYLGWYSNGLTFINCKIIGTQPLCYCKNLKLINCTMEETDLAFEYSDVEADIKGNILSVKNPKSGTIIADSIGEAIYEDSIIESKAKVVIRSKDIETMQYQKNI